MKYQKKREGERERVPEKGREKYGFSSKCTEALNKYN